MKLENQFVSIELAKKLKKLHFKQKSMFYHINPFKNNHWGIIEQEKWDLNSHHEYYSAYTVAELGEMLPKEETFKIKNTGDEWIIKDSDDNCFGANSEADARAEMLIYLWEMNLI